MVENQAIFIVLMVFSIIYLGIFLRYYLISRSQYVISKFFLVKFFIRSFIVACLLVTLFITGKQMGQSDSKTSKYILVSTGWKKKSKQELLSEISEKLTKVNDNAQVGCLVKEKNKYYILFPIIQKHLLIRYFKQLDIKLMPLIPITSSIDFQIMEDKTQLQSKSTNIAFIDTIVANFNIYNISKLRNYLLILTLIVLVVESLFIKKIIKF